MYKLNDNSFSNISFQIYRASCYFNLMVAVRLPSNIQINESVCPHIHSDLPKKVKYLLIKIVDTINLFHKIQIFVCYIVDMTPITFSCC